MGRPPCTKRICGVVGRLTCLTASLLFVTAASGISSSSCILVSKEGSTGRSTISLSRVTATEVREGRKGPFGRTTGSGPRTAGLSSTIVLKGAANPSMAGRSLKGDRRRKVFRKRTEGPI